MTDWRISFAYRPGQSLIDTIADQRHLPAGERETAREILTAFLLDGVRTTDTVLQRLEAASPEQRRLLLDRARETAGLASTTAVEEQRRLSAVNAAAQARAAEALQSCAQPGCNTMPVTDSGALRPVGVKRWWCESHRHLAGEHDLEPSWLLQRLLSGGFREIDSDELARQRAAEQSRQHQSEAQLTVAKAEAEQVHQGEEARRAALDRQLPTEMRRFFTP